MTGPGAAEATARVAVRRALVDLPEGDLVLVACSGGADSLALAAATAFAAPRLGLRAGAVVVDHGLQPGSDDVADRAAATCRALGLAPVEVRRVVVAGGGIRGHGDGGGGAAGVAGGGEAAAGGPEASARAARYAAFERSARAHGAACVLLAHTLDDQAETVLLALARGSGARSLAGMAPRRGAYRRPLLGLRRSDTEAVCRDRGLVWWDDPTNGRDDPVDASHADDGLPLRSRVRAEALPVLERVLGPGVPAALARTAAQLRDDANLLDELAAELLDRARASARESPSTRSSRGAILRSEAVDDHQDPPLVLVLKPLADAPRALRTRALRRAAQEAGCPSAALAATHVAALEALVTRWRGQGPAHLPGPVLASRECGTLVLRPGL